MARARVQARNKKTAKSINSSAKNYGNVPSKIFQGGNALSADVTQTNLYKEISLMNATTKTVLVIAFAIVVILLLLFGGGTMTGATMSGGMMGNGAMGGISWMWIPTLLMLGLGVLLVWVIFGQKK